MTISNEKKLVLCTGGMGYIGSHTVIKLLASGFDVLIVDNLINSDKEVLKRLRQLQELMSRLSRLMLPIVRQWTNCSRPTRLTP